MDQDEETMMAHDHVITMSHDDGTLTSHNSVIMMYNENIYMVYPVGETMMDHGHVHKFPWHDYALL